MTHQDDKTPFLSNRIDYLNVYEDDEAYFSAGVFFLPKGHSLPLHDHKNMLVITKILSGKVMINSYERKNPLNTSTTYVIYFYL